MRFPRTAELLAPPVGPGEIAQTTPQTTPNLRHLTHTVVHTVEWARSMRCPAQNGASLHSPTNYSAAEVASSAPLCAAIAS
jgi:hypothetical protein